MAIFAVVWNAFFLVWNLVFLTLNLTVWADSPNKALFIFIHIVCAAIALICLAHAVEDL